MKENPETRKNALLSSIWMKSVRLCALIPLVFLLVRNAAPATTAELEEKVASDQEALILSIETTREMVKDLLHENEQKIRDARRNEINLIRAGDFYSKPVYPSTQIFFMYLYEEQGKGKNNNKKEWKNTINAIAFRLQGGQTPKGKNPYSEGELRVGLTESLDPVPDKDKDPKIDGDPDYKSVFSFTPEPAGGSVTKSTMAYSPLAVTTSSDPQGALEGGNGVFIEEEPYMETVELGANIKPLNPTLPNITKDVTLNVGSATLTPPPTPTIPTVNPPGTVSATPVTPSTPGAISPVNLNPPTVNKPSTPQAPALSVPTAPTIAEYTPVTVVAPTAPSAPVVTPPGLPTFTLSAASAGSGDAAYFLDNKPTIGTRNTVISEIAITDGTFTATRNAAAGGFTYSFTGYKGYNIYPQSTANTTANGGIAAVATNATATIPDVTNVTTGTAARGMMRALVQAMWNNGDWTYNYTPAAADMGANKDVRELVHYDIHNQGPGNIARNTLKGRLAAAGASAELQNSYQYAEDMAAAARIIAFITSGDITMNGSNMTITNQYNHTSGHQAMHVNDGKIIVQNGSFNAIFMQGGDNNGNDGEIMYNGANGEIFINTYKSAGFAFGTVQNNANQNMPFLANDGLFVLSGDEGSAFYIGKLESGATPSKPNTKIKFNDDPIDRGYGNDTGMLYVFGDLSFGIFVPEKISQSVSSNAGKGIRVSVGGYDSGKFGSATPDDGITENAVGVAIKKQNTATTVELDYHEIHVNGNSKKSVGAVSLVDAGLNLHNGKISVNGGESNIGIYAGAISGDSGSSVTTTGDLIAGNGKVNQNWSGVQDGTGISISAVAIEGSDDSTGFGGSENFAASPGSTYNVAPTYQLATGTGVNIVAYAKGGLDITAANLGGMGSENTVGVYAEGKNGTDASTITITNDVEIIGMTVTTGATNAIAAFAKDGGEISLTNNRLASSSGTKFSDNRLIMDQYPDIEITGKKDSVSGSYAGIGLFAQNGSTITVSGSGVNTGLYIRVSEGGAGVAAIKGTSGTSGSTITIKGATIYVDNGYAIYVEDGSGSTVDFSNGTIVLGGKDTDGDGIEDISGTAFEVKLDNPMPTSPITSTNARIYVTSDRVVVFNLKPVASTLNLSDISTGLSSLVTVESANGVDKWKMGAISDVVLTIDSALNDTGTSVSGDTDLWYHRLVPQNINIIVANNMTVSIDQTHMNKYGETTVIGVVGTAAQKTGLSLSDTGITINATKNVTAERSDTATQGAIGAFINYGILTNNGNIKVEQMKSNPGGQGLLAVNGAQATNTATGTIDVKGKKAVGMAALSYRTGIGAEFTGATGQGQTQLTNNGAITVSGENAIGMYANNNSVTEGARETLTITSGSTGIINATGKYGVGIFADGTGTAADTVINFDGTINVGEAGAGIYLHNGAKLNGIGTTKTINLAKGATGLIIDDKSDITGLTGTVNFAAVAPTDIGSMGVVFLGGVAGTKTNAPQTIGFTINVGTIEGFITVFAKDIKTITNYNSITVSKNGVGIVAENADVINSGTITMNHSTASNPSNGAIGLYTAGGSISNSGSITVAGTGSVGIVADGAAAQITNTAGTITIDESGDIGIFITNGAVLPGTGTISFGIGVKNAYAVVADAATVNFSTSATYYTLTNGDGNTLIYAQDGSNLILNNSVTIDGGSPTPPGQNPTVGFYLNGDVNGHPNTLNGNGNQLTLQHGVIGIYSKKSNIIQNLSPLDVQNDDTVGIYFTDGGALQNTTIKVNSDGGNAIGIYVAGGTVNVSGTTAFQLGPNNVVGGYLTNGAEVSGGTITLTSFAPSGTYLPGFYYTKGTSTGAVTHDTNITVPSSSNALIALFIDDGIEFENTKSIVDHTTDPAGSIGIYVDGSVNTTKFTNKSSGVITEDGTNSIGIYIDGNTTIVNEGNINLTTTGTGIIMNGVNSTFDNTNGMITIGGAGVGIALIGVPAHKVIDAGNISLGNNSVGVYADNSTVDFDVDFLGSATQGVGVYALNNSIITGNLDGSQSSHTTTLYLADNTVQLQSLTITTGKMTSPTATSVGLFLGGSSQAYNIQDATINVPHTGTVGAYLQSGNTLNYHATTTNVYDGAIGIYGDGAGTILNVTGGTINIFDAGTGVVVKNGATGDLGTPSGSLNVNFTGTGGILGLAVGASSTIIIDENIVVGGTGRGSIAVSTGGSLTNATGATLTTGGGGVGLLGIYSSNPASLQTILNDTGATINVDTGGTGIAITGVAGLSNAEVLNKGTINVKDLLNLGSVGIYADAGRIWNNTSSIHITDGGIGIYAKNDVILDQGGVIDVVTTSASTAASAPGVGYLIEGTGVTITAPASQTVNLHGGTEEKSQIGAYFLDYDSSVAGAIDNDLFTINVLGDNTAVFAVDATTPMTTSTSSNITVADTYSGSIGAIAIGSATLEAPAVSVDGADNIGIAGVSGGSIHVTSNVTVADAAASAGNADAPVGIYIKDGGTATIDGTLDAGENTIGAITSAAAIVADNLTAGKDSVGIYSSGAASTVTVGNATSDQLTVETGALGVFAKDGASVSVKAKMDVDEGKVVSGTNVPTVGIVSTGSGSVTYEGTATVADAGTASPSIAIYKGPDASTNATGGNVAIASGSTLNVGDQGYGVYVDNASGTGSVNVSNAATINLGESSVGLFGAGDVTIANTGNITVGETYLGNPPDHEDASNWLNSVGIYGADGAVVSNSGTITVNEDHSVGVYVTKAAFTNTGNINIDEGGVGVLAVDHSTVTNSGTVTTGYTAPICPDGQSVGIGIYNGSVLTNTASGVINVGKGAGVFVGTLAKVINQGNIYVDNGVGILGPGEVVNNGNIEIKDLNSDSVTGGQTIATGGAELPHGAINITNDGKVIINNQYTHVGGTLTASHIVGAGAIVSIVDTAGKPLFIADTIEGFVNLASEFALNGNGYTWQVANFVQTLAGTASSSGSFDIHTSPLFVAHIIGTTGDLVVAKQPYAYLVAGEQFNNLYNGVDSLLAQDQAGTSNDSLALKGLNAYLDSLYDLNNPSTFVSETDRTLAEMRGDIYATIHRRIANINDVFKRGWEELEQSWNFTRESGKWSVLYGQGSYQDETIGIDDYDYRVQGLLYMKEYDGRTYDDKWGWSLGFAVSRFDFDDAPTFGDDSREDVYSVRAGIHKSFTFGTNDGWKLRSRLEIGYNRHEAERTIELNEKYINDASYDSYGVALETKLAKTLYTSLTSDVKVYGDVNLGYGRIEKFTEYSKRDEYGNQRGALELDVKNRDYYNIGVDIGVEASRRFYLGKKISMKVAGDLAYGYEFGNADKVYAKARVHGGTEDYYNLIRPSQEKGHLKGVLGVTFEKANHYGVTLDMEAWLHDNKKTADLRFNVRFNYKFMHKR